LAPNAPDYVDEAGSFTFVFFNQREAIAARITATGIPIGSTQNDYNFRIPREGTGPIAWQVRTGSLPNGLNLDSNTGVISGRPTATGNSTFSIRASNLGGGYHTVTFTMNVREAMPVNITASFTDPKFKSWVLELIGKNEGDQIFDAEVDGFDTVNISNSPTASGIKSLAGIEHFSSLSILQYSFPAGSLSQERLTKLDLSRNEKIGYVRVEYNYLEELLLPPKSRTMQSLLATGNRLKKLDLSGFSNLARIDLQSNELTEIDITDSTWRSDSQGVRLAVNRNRMTSIKEGIKGWPRTNITSFDELSFYPQRTPIITTTVLDLPSAKVNVFYESPKANNERKVDMVETSIRASSPSKDAVYYPSAHPDNPTPDGNKSPIFYSEPPAEITWRLASGSTLPPGLTLGAAVPPRFPELPWSVENNALMGSQFARANAVISGTPTQTGEYRFTIEAYDAQDGGIGSAEFTLKVGE